MSFLLPLGKQHKSNHYLLRCAHCEYAEKVELKSDGFDTWVNPDCKAD